jgi:acyl dehydratase
VRVFESPDELAKAVGTQVGASEWLTIDQDRINLFADATGDHQWIHVDPGKAAQGPFGGTIAHGFLTLSLIPVLVQDIYRVEGVRMGVNYGLNKVRFVTPVPVGSKVRAVLTLDSVTEASGGGLQIASTVVVEIDGVEKPAAVAETLVRVYV